MKMQDNQFDELLRSKLEDFEAEPSQGVWEGIAGHLGKKKDTRSLFPFMGIAASILVLVAAGVLFIPQKVKVNSKDPAHNNIAKAHQSPNIMPIKNKDDQIVASFGPGKLPAETSAKSFNDVSPDKGSPEVELKRAVEVTALATLPQRQQEVINPVVPDKTIELTAKQSLAETGVFVSKPVLLATQIPVATTQDFVPDRQKKHKIHSFGDLVNVVIAKVDKRRDKFIEFSDTDDDQSNITGVNLGIIKIKREK
jgi:hypothetical protein